MFTIDRSCNQKHARNKYPFESDHENAPYSDVGCDFAMGTLGAYDVSGMVAVIRARTYLAIRSRNIIGAVAVLFVLDLTSNSRTLIGWQ